MMPLRTQVSRTMEEAIKQVKNVIQQQDVQLSHKNDILMQNHIIM